MGLARFISIIVLLGQLCLTEICTARRRLGFGHQGDFDVFNDIDPIGGARKPSSAALAETISSVLASGG